MENNKSKRSCLSHSDRINILAKICKGKTLTNIAKDLKKSKSTIIREVNRNKCFPVHPQTCVYCANKEKCLDKQPALKRWICNNFVPLLCTRQIHFPFVCNGCEKLTSCNHAKCYYNCDKSHNDETTKRIQCHKIKMVQGELLEKLNEFISKGVRNGQSLYHIWITNEWIRKLVSLITIRRYLYDGVFDVKPFDLRRFKSFRHSKKYDYSKEKRWKFNVAAKENRTFQDFKNYQLNNKINKTYWEHDSVEGATKSKYAILTFTFAEFPFQFGIKIHKHNSTDVVFVERKLQELFGEDYSKIFNVHLVDNGVEFSKYNSIEIDRSGKQICHVFYTNTYRATDKPHCERNHEFIRYFIPKYTDFDWITQKQINLMFSHINSYVRKSINNKSPYDAFAERFGTQALEKLGIKKIEPKNINLTTSLILNKK